MIFQIPPEYYHLPMFYQMCIILALVLVVQGVIWIVRLVAGAVALFLVFGCLLAVLAAMGAVH
jgi:hypothetical protein